MLPEDLCHQNGSLLKNLYTENHIVDHTTVDHKGSTTEPAHRKSKVVIKIKSNYNHTYKIKKYNLYNPNNGTK